VVKRSRVILMTQWFDPEPTFKGHRFAQELVRNGFEVEVVTGFPNYPGGKIYPGYRMTWCTRVAIDGVSITRLPLYPSHNKSVLGRILNYSSFAIACLVYVAFFARRPDVIYAYHPPLTVGIAAAFIRFFRGTPIVYDIQDMWPDTLRATGMFRSRFALNLVGVACRWVYRISKNLVVLSPGFKRLLVERGVPADRVSVVYNWADECAISDTCGELPLEFPGSNRFKILFAGNLGMAQAIDAVLEAASLLKSINPSISLVMLGGGVEAERLRRKSAVMRLDNVVFLPPVPMREVGAYIQASDALLVHLRKDPLFDVTIPSKTQAYMVSGKPILMAVSGDAAELVKKAKCGLVANPEDPASIADAAYNLSRMDKSHLSQLGENGRRFYWENLCFSIGVSEFSKIFQRVIDGR
jgi:colanic acid biosynthesis glycosyl transferase WcaI